MWHTAAALVPLPLIALGYVAAVPGNPIRFQIELLLSGHGSSQALTRTAEVAPQRLPREAAILFRAGGKGPRADQYLVPSTITSAGKQLIAASLFGGQPGMTGALKGHSEANAALKADRLKPTTSVALRGPVSGADSAMLLSAVANSPFMSPLDVDAFRPSADEIAYHPTPEGMNFRYQGESQAEFEQRERRCLAIAIYFEARGEPVSGQVAVGQVIMNRVRSPLFPETICGVVYQGQMNPGCQFSFTCDGRSDTPRNDEQWALAQDIAKKITRGELWLPEVGYSTFYHANYVRPNWAGRMNKIDTIGRHIFYKKRNEEPYLVEASAGDTQAREASQPESSTSMFSLTPALSLVSSVTNSTVSAVTSPATPATPAMSLGYAGNE
ncbi:MAG TPA: cell wall hydrolase [Methyloceanibacter sp.]|jgi:spore germination cell wall hydrolase CwlJ-like protein|nr:cell wall hydrolase [Methyloceanibacter sp.]